MEYVLKTEGLTKIYSKTRVVDNVDMIIRPGDIYGFVGKNGAGKTTFIRLLLGLARITDGKVSFFDGENIRRARKKTGSLVESPSFYPNMTAEENIRIFCRMIGEDEKQAKSVLEKVGLADTGRKKAGHFSLGMKQRLGLALALVGDPEFLILDEPINGLDPTGIAEIRKLILSLKNEQGKTLLISSHLISELEKIGNKSISAEDIYEYIVATEKNPVPLATIERCLMQDATCLSLSVVGENALNREYQKSPEEKAEVSRRIRNSNYCLCTSTNRHSLSRRR